MLKLLIASVAGGFLGASLILLLFIKIAPPSCASTSLVAKEVSIVNEDGEPMVKISASQSAGTLTFFQKTSGPPKPAIVVGVEGESRHLRFHSPRGEIVLSLQSTSPQSASTIYLGDSELGTRVILGALQTDVDLPPGTESSIQEWALQLRDPVYRKAVVEILAQPDLYSNGFVGSVVTRRSSMPR